MDHLCVDIDKSVECIIEFYAQNWQLFERHNTGWILPKIDCLWLPPLDPKIGLWWSKIRSKLEHMWEMSIQIVYPNGLSECSAWPCIYCWPMKLCHAKSKPNRHTSMVMCVFSSLFIFLLYIERRERERERENQRPMEVSVKIEEKKKNKWFAFSLSDAASMNAWMAEKPLFYTDGNRNSYWKSVIIVFCTLITQIKQSAHESARTLSNVQRSLFSQV